MKKWGGTSASAWLWLCFFLLSLFSFIFSFISCDAKETMAILPLTYCTLCVVFYKNYVGIINNIPKLMIHALFFVRMAALPLLYSMNAERQLFQGSISVDHYFSQACWLMVYELFVVHITMYCYDHVRRRRIAKRRNVSTSIDISKRLLWGIGLYLLVVFLFARQYTPVFKMILQLGDNDFTVASKHNLSVGSIGRAVRTLYGMFFKIFRILCPAYCIIQAYLRKPDAKLATIVLIVGCVFQLFFISDTFAEVIIVCLVLILLYLKCYPERTRSMMALMAGSTVGMLVIYFIVRYNVRNFVSLYTRDTGFLVYITEIINAYFTGVDNVAAIFRIPSGFQWSAMRAEILGAIPFNTTLFGDIGNKLQYYYNSYTNAYGQIPPTIGVGYYYFGPVFAPIITVAFTWISLRYSDKARYEKITLRYAVDLFSSIVFALGLVMYSPAIVLQWFFCWIVPMLIITRFTGERTGN